jgi:hypothetical protein
VKVEVMVFVMEVEDSFEDECDVAGELESLRCLRLTLIG